MDSGDRSLVARLSAILTKEGDMVSVFVPTAFAQQARFIQAVARVAKDLGPHVISVAPSLGTDWSGEPAVFFTVVLSDAASSGVQLLQVTKMLSNEFVYRLQPLEKWGVLPYFNFRSESEQAKIDRRTVA